MVGRPCGQVRGAAQASRSLSSRSCSCSESTWPAFTAARLHTRARGDPGLELRRQRRLIFLEIFHHCSQRLLGGDFTQERWDRPNTEGAAAERLDLETQALQRLHLRLEQAGLSRRELHRLGFEQCLRFNLILLMGPH